MTKLWPNNVHVAKLYVAKGVFFGNRMVNMSLIDFKIGLYIKGNVTAWQNKFEVHTNQFAQNSHQLAQNRPDATLAT